MARIFRLLGRYRAIAAILTRHGLGFLVDHLGLRRFVPAAAHRDDTVAAGQMDQAAVGARIRKVLEELGPTFIKIGQVASTRADLVPPDILKELQKLQDRVPPVPFDQIEKILLEELGPRYQEITYIDPDPLAVASIGQVHAATLNTGDEVVIKVQRPGASRTVEADLEILTGLAELMDRHSPLSQWYDFRQAAAEIAATLRRELDYTQEATNAIRLRSFRQSRVYVPDVYWRYTTSRVLTMERLRGEKLSASAAASADQADRSRLARQLISGILEQILIYGVFHADPHPGNVMVLDDGRIGLMDFGIVGRLDDTTREHLALSIIYLIRGNNAGLLKTVKKLLNPPDSVDWDMLRHDLEDLRSRFYRRPFMQVELGEIVQTFFDILRRHQLQVPPGLALVGKTLITLEGVAQDLDPELTIVEIAQPLGSKIIQHYLTPRTVASRMISQLESMAGPLLQLPGLLRDYLDHDQASRRSVRVQLDSEGIWLRKLEQLANRLLLGIIFFALAVLIAGTAIANAISDTGASLWGFSLLQIAAVALLICGAMLIWSLVTSHRR